MSSIPVIVVGYTTQTSSRIFVCVEGAREHELGHARLWWRASGRAGAADVALRWADPYAIGVAELVDLPAGARVEYTVDHAIAELPEAPPTQAWHSFKLLPSPSEPLRVGLVSCIGSDEVPEGTRYKLWSALGDRIRDGEIDLVLHAGDQIYGDAIRDHHDGAGESAIRRRYREQYVRTWRDGAVQRVHRSCPSIMMWDDHEFFDGYGSRSDHHTDLTRVFFRAATRAFEEFQISHGPPSLDGASSFATAFRHGAIGFLVVDGRRNRSPTTVLGEAQLEAVARWVDQQAASLEHLFVVAAIPFAHASLGVFLACIDEPRDAPHDHWYANMIRGLKDRWVAPDHRDECARILALLFRATKRRRPEGLRVTILSGDVHVGTTGVIESLDHDAAIPQITSSGIGSLTPRSWYRLYMWLGTLLAHWFSGRLGERIYGRLQLVRGAGHPALMRRNFAVVALDERSGRAPRRLSYRYFAERDPSSPEIDELPQPDPVYER